MHKPPQSSPAELAVTIVASIIEGLICVTPFLLLMYYFRDRLAGFVSL